MRGWWRAVVAAGAIFWSAALAAVTLHHAAENRVQMVMTEAVLRSNETVVVLQTQSAIRAVCWTRTGPNSPYLLSDGRRYPLIKGDNIGYCPDRRDYAANETMRLHFEPLPADAAEFSLIEGLGGESPLANGGEPKDRYWNFLHVKLPQN